MTALLSLPLIVQDLEEILNLKDKRDFVTVRAAVRPCPPAGGQGPAPDARLPKGTRREGGRGRGVSEPRTGSQRCVAQCGTRDVWVPARASLDVSLKKKSKLLAVQLRKTRSGLRCSKLGRLIPCFLVHSLA